MRLIRNSLLFFIGCSLELLRQKHPAPSCHVSQRAFNSSSVVDATAGEQTPGNVMASRLSISIYRVFACSKDMHSPESPKSSGDSSFLGEKVFVSGRILKVLSEEGQDHQAIQCLMFLGQGTVCRHLSLHAPCVLSWYFF